MNGEPTKNVPKKIHAMPAPAATDSTLRLDNSKKQTKNGTNKKPAQSNIHAVGNVAGLLARSCCVTVRKNTKKAHAEKNAKRRLIRIPCRETGPLRLGADAE